MLGRTLFVFGAVCSFTCATQRAFLLNAAAFRFMGVPCAFVLRQCILRRQAAADNRLYVRRMA